MKTDRMQIHLIIIAVVLIAAIIALSLVFSGCFPMIGGKKYKVDYNGQKDSFEGARDYYRVGEKVSLAFGMIATDTDYSFYVDGEKVNPKYDEKKGYIIEFVMPERDVSVKWSSRNSMMYDPNANPEAIPEPEEVEETMLVDYYHAVVATVGGDNSHELVLYEYSDDKLKLSVFDADEDSGETRTDYLVPKKVLDECKEVIKRNKFDKWNKKYEDIGMDGAVTVVKYQKDDGSYERISTDRMPDDGIQKMGEIQTVLSKYIKDEYKVK